MRLRVVAVGRMKSGPEREIADRYLERAAKGGKALGITRFDVRETPEGRAPRSDDRKAEEAAALLAEVPEGAALVVLDEAGRAVSSQDLADFIDRGRASGVADIVFAIGGPDGHGAAVRARADLTIAFGAMTWPHQLVRLMLAEQIYRALTIVSGHPYHRS